MLSSLLSKFILSLLSIIGGWLVRHFQEWWKDKKQAEADEKKTADATKALEDAKTKEELDDAAKNIAGNFGK